MGVNFFLLCAGLVICFGGIYFKKIVSGLLGFIWGVVLGVVVLLFMGISQRGLWFATSYLEDDSYSILVIIFAVIVCVISVALERLCAAINAFINSFIIVLVVMLLFAEDIDSLNGIILITTVICAVIALAAYIYYNYAFIIVTAFSGAYIATIAGIGLYYKIDFSDVITQLIFYQESEIMTVVYGITIVLGACGFFVQHQRLKNPVLKDTGDIESNQRRRVWENLTMENILLFIPNIMYSIMLPILYRIAISTYSASFFTFLNWVDVITSGMTIGILVYFVIAKDLKLNLIYLLPFTLNLIVSYFGYIKYYDSISLSIFVMIFKYFILWGLLYIVCKMINKDNIKPIILAVSAFFIDQFLLDWISYQYVSFYVDVHTMLQLATIVGTIYFLFIKYHHVNIFKI